MSKASNLSGTPYKDKTAGSKFGGTLYGPQKSAETVQADLAHEVGPYQHDNISVLNFAHHIWGLDLDVGRKILDMNFTLDPLKVEEYYRKPKERDLHDPFKEFATTLLSGVASGLRALGYPVSTWTDAFWDAKGEKELKHDGRSRKPDVASLWKTQMPLSEKELPEWTYVKHVVEFKHQKYKAKGPTLPSLSGKAKQRIKQGFHTGSLGLSLTQKGKANNLTDFNSERKAPSSLNSDSASSMNTNNKRARNSASEDGPDSKRNRLEGKKSQVGQYAIECLSATSRRWVSGLLIDTTVVTACYFDRHMVVCTTPFRFELHPARLALILYAMDTCSKDRAGFDPHLLPSPSVPDPDTLEAEKTEEPDLTVPVSMVIGAYFEFPENESLIQEGEGSKEDIGAARSTSEKAGSEENLGGDEEITGRDATAKDGQDIPATTPTCLKIVDFIRKPDDLISRGTMVFKVQRRLESGKFSDNFYALKLSWPLKNRVSEIDIIKHLKSVLPESSHDHIPNLFFSKTWTAEELNLPWIGLKLSLDEKNHQERVLRGLGATYYNKLWEAGSIDKFQQAWLDCVEFCYLAYRVGHVMHRDLSENNLMVLPMPDDTVKGVLNDWDMAKFIQDQADLTFAGHHRTGTPPFMAMDILRSIVQNTVPNAPPPPAPPHWLRHDLESLIYILVWAALHYDIAKGTRDDEVHTLVKSWTGSLELNVGGKNTFLTGGVSEDNLMLASVKPGFEGIAQKWIIPLRKLLKLAVFFGNDDEEAKYNYGGHFTFKNFMKAIGVKPRTWGLPESFLDGDI